MNHKLILMKLRSDASGKSEHYFLSFAAESTQGVGLEFVVDSAIDSTGIFVVPIRRVLDLTKVEIIEKNRNAGDMMKTTELRFEELASNWESLALHELYSEYAQTLKQHNVRLRPAALEVADSDRYWGQWIAQARIIRLSRRLLMSHPWPSVVGILRHEMAHQCVDEAPEQLVLSKEPRDSASNFSGHHMPHGELFRRACEKLGVPQEFTKATINLTDYNLDWRTDSRDEATEKMLERVRKLLALATSQNEHEALLAMNRVREIYAKYHLHGLNTDRPCFVHSYLLEGRKRFEAHERKIVGLLVGHFFVQAIYTQPYHLASGEHRKCIELIGTRENVLMAEYVFWFLIQQTDAMATERPEIDLRHKSFSRIARKSYRLGILDGFGQKLRQSETPFSANRDQTPSERAHTNHQKNDDPTNRQGHQQSHQQGDHQKNFDHSGVLFAEPAPPSNQLISQAIEAFKEDHHLDDYISSIYPRLRTCSDRRQTVHGDLYMAGISAGRQMNLHRPVTSEQSSARGLLPLPRK